MQSQTLSQNTPGDAFVCDVCGQKYTRLDHLTRHQRSHTQERPFHCVECGKSFARTDLLKRHALGHEKEGPTNKKLKISAQQIRHRTAQACLACAKSKLRCDGAEVCSRCDKRKIICIYKSPMNTSGGSESRQGSVDDSSVQQTPHQPSSPFKAMSVEAHVLNHGQHNSVGMDQMHHWDGFPQLPTPVTFEEGPLRDKPSVDASASNIDFDDTYLADFLKDIINPGDGLPGAESHDVNFAPRDFLDFNFATSFEYLDGYDIPPQTNLRQSLDELPGDPNVQLRAEQANTNFARSGYVTPTGKSGLGMSAQAFKESLWLWTPEQGDHTQAYHANISIPVESFIPAEQEGLGPMPFPLLGQAARDSVLATVLDCCGRTMAAVVVSSFPSAELLSVLIHKWIVYHKNQVDNWFHTANFDPNKETPNILICLVAAGAALSKNPRIRKLGYAFQEAARATNASTFERDNRNVRKLRPMQSLALVLDVGIWSGDRRKVEIAESFAQCLVTMFRRGSFFARSDDNSHVPMPDDDSATLNSKWMSWIEAESLRRLATHLLIKDCQTSASLLIPPLVSFAEVTCPLPAVRSIWMAQDAREWADLMYMFAPSTGYAQNPSIRSCLHDMSSISNARRHIDVELSILAISHAFWGPCWQHRQGEAIARHTFDDLQHNSFMTNSIKQAAVQRLLQFRLLSSEIHEARPESVLVAERVFMNLHVSLEDVQLLAGKGGEQEARRTFSTLRYWARSSDSRQAVWHAGQIIRAAREYSLCTLRDACAVAVYHAGLVLWAYSILTNADKSSRQTHDGAGAEIIINGDNNAYLERYVMLNKGTPVIRLRETRARIKQPINIPVSDARRVMKAIAELLHVNNGSASDECPPLVDNLSKLMRSLGNAARSIRDIEIT